MFMVVTAGRVNIIYRIIFLMVVDLVVCVYTTYL